MSVNNWSPEGQTKTPSQKDSISIDPQWIIDFIAYGDSDDIHNLAALISDDEQRQMVGIMRLSREDWLPCIEALDNTQLLALIRFLTCAEMQLPGWRADEHSPVIGIAKLIRARGEKLDRELLLWIRKHSDNRFLPYGSVL